MVKEKLKYLFSVNGFKQKQIAEKMGISSQFFNNRLRLGVCKIDDLIKYADFTGTQLAFIDKKTGKVVVSFDIDDIKKD